MSAAEALELSWRRYCQSILASPHSPPPRCLLHCAAGLNRSPLTAIYWLVCHHHIQPSVAWQYVAIARSRVNAASSKPLSSSKSPVKKEWSEALLAKTSKKIAPQLQLWSMGVIQDALANVRALQAAHAWHSVSSSPVTSAAVVARVNTAADMVFTFVHSLILAQEPIAPSSTASHTAAAEHGTFLHSSAPSSLFLPGDTVIITGLVSAKHFNGLTAVVQPKLVQDPADRVKVLLPDNKAHFIKESNLVKSASRQVMPLKTTSVIASSTNVSAGSPRSDLHSQLAQITHNYLVTKCHTSPSTAIRSDLLGQAICCNRPVGSESIKMGDVLRANPNLFVCTRTEHGQFLVYATKTASITSQSPRSDLQASSAAAEVTSTTSHAVATSSTTTMNSSRSSSFHTLEEDAFLTAAHNYLTTYGHTSKSTRLDLSKLCMAESVRKHKSPSNSFKPSEALKAHVHMFRVVIKASGADVYAVEPPNGPIEQAEQFRHQIGSTVRHDGVRDMDTLRHARTVFVSQVSSQATCADLQQFFSLAGQVTDVQLKAHAKSNMSLGYAFVSMDSSESARKALALSGQHVLGLPCIVKKYQAHLDSSVERQRSGEDEDIEGSRKRNRET